MTELTNRPYVASDLAAVIEIFQRAMRDVACKDYRLAQIAAWSETDCDEWAPHRLSRPAWIAEVGKSAAGFTDLEANGHLDMMFVHPDHQGRSIATALLAQVEEASGVLKLAEIFTEANITARPFFERRGFQLTAAQSVACGGQFLTNFRMRKTLLPDNRAQISNI